MSGSLCILWIDDDIGFIEFEVAAVRAAGHRVECATNLDDAVQLLGDKQFDLVIVDLFLPGSRTFVGQGDPTTETSAFLSWLQDHSPSTAVVVHSLRERVDPRAFARPKVQVVPKVSGIEELLSALATVAADRPTSQTAAKDASLALLQIAARSLVFLLPNKTYPHVQERVSEFMADRGAVGYVVRDVEDNLPLEAVCQRYWQSRIDQTARLEDLVTGLILSFLVSIAASVVHDQLRKRAGSIGFIREASEPEILERAIDKLKSRRENALTLMALYRLKITELEHRAREWSLREKALLDHVAAGGSVRDFVTANNLAEQIADAERTLAHAGVVVTGVVQTELDRRQALAPPIDAQIANAQSSAALDDSSIDDFTCDGLPLALGMGVGEVLIWPGPESLHSEVDWIALKLGVPFLTPEAWDMRPGRTPSRKVVVLSQHADAHLINRYSANIAGKVSAFVGLGHGATSHLAVYCRSVGIPAVSIAPDVLTRKEHYPFAVVSESGVRFFRRLPSDLYEHLQPMA